MQVEQWYNIDLAEKFKTEIITEILMCSQIQFKIYGIPLFVIKYIIYNRWGSNSASAPQLTI